MIMPDFFEPLIVGNYLKCWNSYYDKETKTRHYFSQWIAKTGLTAISRNGCEIVAGFNFSPEENHIVGRLETEEDARVVIVELITRLSNIGLSDNLKSRVVALEQ